MREWSDRLNPLNSLKMLMWREWLEGCAQREVLPPISVDIDPTNRCNYDCVWCNSRAYRRSNSDTLPLEHWLRLLDFLREWKVRSVCLAGGGEPSLHPDVAEILYGCRDRRMQAAIVTNGYALNEESCKAIAATCRWAGFSMDAGSAETYARLKRPPDKWGFGRVLANMKRVAAECQVMGYWCKVNYKFLLHPLNAHEIALAARRAKNHGAHFFHVRPVSLTNYGMLAKTQAVSFEGLYETINDQIEEARELEDLSFRVFGITHKFGPDLKKARRFSQCWASPMITTFGADGNVHLCFDMRGKPEMILCRHVPEPREILAWWGSPRHRAMLQAVDVDRCPHCTFGFYNEIVERVFQEDGMHRLFP